MKNLKEVIIGYGGDDHGMRLRRERNIRSVSWSEEIWEYLTEQLRECEREIRNVL